jgi:hypothetical protein
MINHKGLQWKIRTENGSPGALSNDMMNFHVSLQDMEFSYKGRLAHRWPYLQQLSENTLLPSTDAGRTQCSIRTIPWLRWVRRLMNRVRCFPS